jgi:16S rRNA (cytosine1402-N4)-methyltransferase
MSGAPHMPVMLAEVLAALRPAAGEVYVDGTFGAGGYTRALLEAGECTVTAIDRDGAAVARAEELKREYGDRFVFLSGCFGDALDLVRAAGYEYVDGFVLDLGVSSMQLDQAERGFSFRFDGPLDMRMGAQEATETAADLVARIDEDGLIAILKTYGEEKFARRIARRILEAREKAPIMRTGALADIVRAAVPRTGKDKIDPATRTFQALRIAVNDELGELRRALAAAEHLLKPGGRLVIVSFHSLEDGIVKQFMFAHSGRVPRGSRHLPELPGELPPPAFTLPVSKPVFPGEAETARNPRARSARLRAAIRTEAPPSAAETGAGAW